MGLVGIMRMKIHNMLFNPINPVIPKIMVQTKFQFRQSSFDFGKNCFFTIYIIDSPAVLL